MQRFKCEECVRIKVRAANLHDVARSAGGIVDLTIFRFTNFHRNRPMNSQREVQKIARGRSELQGGIELHKVPCLNRHTVLG
jgi:hypothetical protein